MAEEICYDTMLVDLADSLQEPGPTLHHEYKHTYPSIIHSLTCTDSIISVIVQ